MSLYKHYEEIDNLDMGSRKSSKKNTPNDAVGDEFTNELDELVESLDENVGKPNVIKGNEISSALSPVAACLMS